MNNKYTSVRFLSTTFGALLIISVLGVAAACSSGSGTTTTTSPTSTSSSGGVSFSKDVQPVFNSSCVTCHQGTGSALPSSMSLEPSKSYGMLVGVQSTESSELRVKAGSPDQSYLIAKLNGTQAAAGGNGAQMPYGAGPLSSSVIATITQWISAGAPNN